MSAAIAFECFSDDSFDMEGSVYLEIDPAVAPIGRRYRRRALSWHLLGRRQASAHLLPFERFVPPRSARGGWKSEVCRRYVRIHMPNQALQATAAALRALAVAMRHNAVVAGASALPAAVPELGR